MENVEHTKKIHCCKAIICDVGYGKQEEMSGLNWWLVSVKCYVWTDKIYCKGHLIS